MKKILFSIFAGTCLLASPVLAQDRAPTDPYISIHGGYSHLTGPEASLGDVSLDYDSDSSFVLGGAVGATIAENFRGEVEFSYREFDGITIEDIPSNFYKSEVTDISVMLNGYYDIYNSSYEGIVPFLMGGIGVAALDSETTLNITDGLIDGISAITITESEDDMVLAYQLGVGFGIDIMEDSAAKLVIGYRYYGTLEAEFDDTEVDGIGTHEIYVGLRFPIGN